MRSILYQFPEWLQRLLFREALWREQTEQKRVYLTFDDGPVPEVTPQVLDILDRFQIKATFFWVGENLIKYPHLAQEVVRRGSYLQPYLRLADFPKTIYRQYPPHRRGNATDIR